MSNRSETESRDGRTHVRVRVADKEVVERESDTRRVDMIDIVTAMRLLWEEASEGRRRGAIDRVHEIDKIPA